MNKGLLRAITLSLAFIALACSGQGGGDKKSSFDFRQTRWGMSQEEVKSSEKGSPTDERPEVITYRDDYGGMQTLTGFVFEAGKLVSGGYVFMDRHQDPADYISDYESLKKSLIDQYGRPEADRIDWTQGEDPEEDPAKFGEAVCSGRLRYLTVWETYTSLIKLTLDRRRDHCQIAIQFESLNHLVIPQADKNAESGEPPLP